MRPRTAPIALALLLAAVPALPAAADDRHGPNRHGEGHGVRHDAHHADRHDTGHRDDSPRSGRDRYERFRYDGHIEDRRDFETRRADGHRDGHRDARHARHPAFYPHGHRLAVLPRTHLRLVLGDSVYFYFDGVYVTPRRGAYVVVGAPLGARVRDLPTGYVSFFLGPRRYVYANATYYLYDDRNADYVVVEKPRGADDALADGGPNDLFVYPAEGQTWAQRERDRDACHAWALTETGRAAYRAAPGTDGHDDYVRALGACLQARGYAVR